MIRMSHRGNFNNLEKFLNRVRNKNYLNILAKYGQEGVNALATATPSETGLTASSWYYVIDQTAVSTSISWANSNDNNGVNIAVILQFGHGTGTGGYVSGIDYINPALKPVFDKIAAEVWKEVTTS